MLAFQAPPEAVIAPVTHDPKMPGPISAFHARPRRSPMLAAISRRSFGMLCAPPITLNSRYHCAPSAISSMLPQLRLDAQLDEPERREREKKVGGKRRQDLNDRLGDSRELRAESDGDADRRPDQSAEDQQDDHPRAGRQAEQRRVPDFADTHPGQNKPDRRAQAGPRSPQ